MNSQEKKHSILITVIAVIFSVIVFFAAFLTMWFWGDTYPDFNEFQREFEIPGIDEGSTPQGMTNFNYKVLNENGEYSEKTTQDYIFISSYMKNAPARIYVTGKRTGYIGYVTVKNLDGSAYTGHAGGIATNGYTFWLGMDKSVLCMRTAVNSGYEHIVDEIIKTARNNGVIQVTGSFNVNCNASFLGYYDDPLNIYNDSLYVGEFYNSRYPTNETSKFTYYKNSEGKLINPDDYIVDGDRFYEEAVDENGKKVKGEEVIYKKICTNAVMYEFGAYLTDPPSSYNTSNKYGLYVTTVNGKSVPTVRSIYLLPDEIQGAAFSARTKTSDDGKTTTISTKTLILSQSYALKNSNLLCYDFNKINSAGSTYKNLTGKNFVYPDAGEYTSSVSVYFVDDFTLIKNYSVPSMSEGICTVWGKRDNKIYVLFESAAKKYSPFVRQKLNSVYSFKPPENN